MQWVVGRQAREAGHTDDLMQVGRIALVQALERYEPTRGVRFTSYAIKIISGTLKHYYRDRVSMIRVPRPVQDLSMELPRIQEKLTHRLGRLPNESEIAAVRGSARQRSLRGTARVSTPISLNRSTIPSRPGVWQRPSAPLTRTCMPMVEFAPLHNAIDRLEERQRFIVQRRYFDDWSQTRVASSLGISQMHVSRLERDGLRKLRTYLGADAVTGHAMAN